MAGATPPKIDDSQKNFIGVGTRELVIAGAGLVGAVLIYMTDMPQFFKILLAIIVAGVGVGLAFGRDQKTGRRFEEMITDVLRFYGREKFHQKGIEHKEEYPVEEERPPKPKKEPREPLIKVQPISLSTTYFIQVCSLAFLVAFGVYIWGGGLDQLIFRANH